MVEENKNTVIISPRIDLWAKETYPEEFLKLLEYIDSLPNISDKRFRRSTEINIKRIKSNFFNTYNLTVSHNIDIELLNKEIEQNANAETVKDLTGNSSCFGFTPILYSPLGYKQLPLVMSARHIYLCSNPFGFYYDDLANYHNLDISVLKDIPNNLNNVIFIYQGKRQKESIVSVLDYDIPVKDEYGNVTSDKTKLQLVIKPKKLDLKTFFSDLSIESNLLATAFEYSNIKNANILYVNKNKKSLAQQLISHSIPSGRNRTEVVSNTGFYKNNVKHYIEDVNKKIKLKEPFLYNEEFINKINLEIEKNDKPDVERIIANISDVIIKASEIPRTIQTISDSVLSFEQNKSDNLDIIGKQFEIDSTGKPTSEGIKQLSKAMEIYSDKHYETARYLFVKDGVIIRHKTVTAQIPASTIIKPDEKFLYDLKSYAEETGSKIVFLHNHPSGYVEPSEADIELTNYLTNFFEESKDSNLFCGHIILDHGTYGLYDSIDRTWNALIKNEIKPLSEISKNYKIQLTEHKKKASFNDDYTISEQSLKELAEYAKSCDSGEVWNTKDWIPSFLLTGNGIVTSLEYINTVEFLNEEVLSEKLKFLGRKYGSENIIMLPADKQQFLICERYAQDSGKIKDVFLINKDGSFEVSEFRNGNIFNDLRKDEIIVTDTNDIIEKVNKKIIYEQSVNKNINKENNKENNTMAKMTNEERAKLTGEDLWNNFNSHMDAVYSQLALEANTKNREVLFIDFNDSFEKELIENYTREQRDYLRNRVKTEYNEVDLSNALSSYKERLKNKYEEDLSVMDDIFFSNSEESKQEVKENFETNNLAPAIDISEDKKEMHNNHQSDEMTENNSSYVEVNEEIRKRDIIIEQLKIQNQNINENYQTLLKEISALKQQILAPKEAQEKSANDSVGYGGSQSSQEYSNLTNQDGFGRETAYKKNQKVPTFGILQDDGSHQIIKNAVFSKLLVDDENPANNKIELLILKENGKQEPVQISEKTYNDIINNVQEFEQRKQGQNQDSFEWMKAHLDYAQKMGTDDNSFRLSTAENFIHNFRVHCMRDEAHNPDEALKVAGIMYDRMAKRDKERFLKMRKAWNIKAKKDGGPTFDEHLIKQFNEFHPKKDVNIDEIKDRYFNAEEALDKQNLMYESLRSGKIQGTNTSIGDTISFAMIYKDMFSGKSLKTPKEDWKIVEVSKCLHGDSALIYNEKSKAYYKLPLENLVEQIRKNERIKSKEEKKTIKKDHKKLGYDGPER